MQEVKYIFSKLKLGDLVHQHEALMDDLSEYLVNNRFIIIAANRKSLPIMMEWVYPMYGHLNSKIVPKKDLVLYTHWPLKSKGFFKLLEEGLK